MYIHKNDTPSVVSRLYKSKNRTISGTLKSTWSTKLLLLIAIIIILSYTYICHKHVNFSMLQRGTALIDSDLFWQEEIGKLSETVYMLNLLVYHHSR